MKFGKQIQHQARPEWSNHYMNYKGLKKIIGKGDIVGKGMLTVASIPGNCELPDSPISMSASTVTVDNAPITQDTPSPVGSGEGTDNAAFFYRLDRELEKVNGFYLKKEGELKLRLRSLADKRKVIQLRPGSGLGQPALWAALKEAFTQYQADLDKLQQFVEINGTGFRKILKKFDKRSFSKTKDLYLSRQVRIQKCFGGSVMAELADACASNLAAIQVDLDSATPRASPPVTTFGSGVDDFEGEMFKALADGASTTLNELGLKHPEVQSRVFWRACSEGAPIEMVQQLISLRSVDCRHTDDITGRTGLHETAIRGDAELALVCLSNGADPQGVDMYGRTPLHYSAMYGRQEVGSILLNNESDPSLLDHEGHSALIYAISAGHSQFAKTLISLGHLGGDASRALRFACQFGHQDIAELLLGSATIDSALDDLQPLHLASREGHATICHLLCQHGVDLDALDGDKGWTPLFFAASEGHVECVRVLVGAGCRVDISDESGLTCVYYAAYEGHVACVQALLDAGCPDSTTPPEELVDEIPSLLLPPPLLPFRIYGHNYLDRSHLVQIQLSHPPVRLYGNSGMASLRLILTPRPNHSGDAQSIILPLADPQQVYSFEVPSLGTFGLDFTIFPTFGTQPMGKAAALSTHFDSCSGQITCPLFDAHLKVVGEVSFTFSVIRPYTTAALEVGGKIDTYWRAPAATPLLSTGGNLASLVTESSLVQEYLQIVVHVTRDHVPVVFPSQFLDVGGLEICPSSITYAQYCRLTHPTSISWAGDNVPLSSLREAVHSARLSLSETLSALPPGLGVCLEVAYSSAFDAISPSVDHVADTILDVVYAHVREFSPDHPQRAFIFTSFYPPVCNALNWKQPNYAVFISTYGGWGEINKDEGTSLKTAVQFAKCNNLLGIICQDTPLRQVPELARRIKESGLLLATFGANNTNPVLSKDDPAQAGIDILITDGVLRYSSGA